MLTTKRKAIVEVLKDIDIDKPILLPYSEEEIKELFFEKTIDQEGQSYYLLNGIMKTVYNKIDFSNIPFDNVWVSSCDFSEAYGLKINPQKVYKKDLNGIILSENARIIGNETINQKDLFEGVTIKSAKFNGCQNVRINPQTIYEKSLYETSLKGVDFTGFTFDGVDITYANFYGSTGAVFDPNKVRGCISARSLANVTLTDLPERMHYNNSYLNGSNYPELIKELKKMQSDFYSLIEDQLPPKKEEQTLEVVEPQKAKRKWFN